MDNRTSRSNPNPRDTANIFSVITWTWTFRLFKTGYSKILGIDDLYDPVKKDRSKILGARLEKQWFAEQQRAKRHERRPSFLRAICRTFASEIFLLGCFQIITELVLRLGTPLILGALLQYFKVASDMPYETAIYYATGMIAAEFVTTISINQSIFMRYHEGGRIRIAVCSVIYRKALRLSKTALGQTASGKVVNLIANDVTRFEMIFVCLHHMWSAPLSAIIITILLSLEIGWSALVGTSIIFLVVPVQGYLGKLSSKYRLQTSLKTDERVRLMDEIISGVQVIKMYAWEKSFCALVELARRLELEIVKKSSYIRGIYMTFALFNARIALFGVLMTMMLRGQELTAQKVFVYMSYFNLISLTMFNIFVRGISEIAECNVAINRIQYFLMYEEFQLNNVDNGSLPIRSKNNDTYMKSNTKDNRNKSKDNLKQNTMMETLERLNNDIETENVLEESKNESHVENWPIKLKHVTAKWDLDCKETILDDITVEVAEGKLYILIGMVGSGKSSFISTILGEMTIITGTIEVKGSVSFADQDAWVFGASVRQNIIFGQKFDRKRYTKVIKVCALQNDFQQFPNGDQTIVGERGSSLSGGQKARINLARAIYRQADIYLLDDSLSAVDAHVGKHLFEECLQKHLSGKTRLLATHQLQYIKDADTILLLDQGKLYRYDNYHELLLAYPNYKTLIAEEKVSTEETISIADSKRRYSVSSTRSRASESGTENDGDGIDDEKSNQDTFIEGTSRGAVKGTLFGNYIKSGASNMAALVVLILFLTTQACVSFNDYFISILVNAEESRNYYNKLHKNSSFLIATNQSTLFFKEKDILPRDYYVYIYTILVISILLVGSIRSLTFVTVCLRASQRLHNLAFAALIRATMRFFDTNPSGRILNRFSKDLGAIDELLPRAIIDAVQSILATLGVIIVTCTINLWFLLPVLLIGILFSFIRVIYLKTSKEIKRLEGMTRSPVFTHLNATLNGLSTIRAFQAEDILKEEFDKLQDTHSSSWYMFIATSIAFGFSLDLFCFIFIAMVVVSFLLLKEHFTGGAVGLAITQVMKLTRQLQWGMRQSAEVTNHLMSVERVLEYSQLPSEPNLRDKGILKKEKKKLKNELQEVNLLIEPSENWPTKGRIEFKDVSMRYSAEYPPVLKNLTLVICSSEKIGIVGRTGAGKSSLISALFRLAKVEGIVEIDGIDTGTIALEDLRKQISIIPQDPVLFSGTLRRNLDPLNEFSDKLLWKVLEEVELKDSVKVSGDGLDHRVHDRGSNYSTGQRQLICLARAILRNNRILIMDEATANIDPHTDAFIQRTIRTKFAPCTVLTIAHRLNTIMDSDKVIVMDKGQLVEFDYPHLLLQNKNGLFSFLVQETGQTMYEHLLEVAHESYKSKHCDT